MRAVASWTGTRPRPRRSAGPVAPALPGWVRGGSNPPREGDPVDRCQALCGRRQVFDCQRDPHNAHETDQLRRSPVPRRISGKTAAPLTGGVRLLWAPAANPPGCWGSFHGADVPLDPNGLGHVAPGSILLTLKTPEVGRGARKGRVIQERRYVLDALAGLPTEPGRRVPKDVQ